MDLTNLFANLAVFVRGLADPVPKPEAIDAPRGRGSKVIAVRNDYKLEVLPGPERHRRAHAFHDLSSFAEWLKRWAPPEKTEILVGETEARAIVEGPEVSLDPASAVKCQLRYHPTFATWQKAFGVKMTPKVLLAFVRSVSSSFSENAGEILSGHLAQLKAVTTGEIDMSVDARGFYAVRGNTARVTVDAKIPPVFTIRTPIFVGIPSSDDPHAERLYALEILLSMDVDDSAISFSLSCPALDRILHDARLDAVDHLRALLGGDFLVGLGDLTTVVVPG